MCGIPYTSVELADSSFLGAREAKRCSIKIDPVTDYGAYFPVGQRVIIFCTIFCHELSFNSPFGNVIGPTEAIEETFTTLLTYSIVTLLQSLCTVMLCSFHVPFFSCFLVCFNFQCIFKVVSGWTNH